MYELKNNMTPTPQYSSLTRRESWNNIILPYRLSNPVCSWKVTNLLQRVSDLNLDATGDITLNIMESHGEKCLFSVKCLFFFGEISLKSRLLVHFHTSLILADLFRKQIANPRLKLQRNTIQLDFNNIMLFVLHLFLWLLPICVRCYCSAYGCI